MVAYAENGMGGHLKFLIYGNMSWIGGEIGKICGAQGIIFEFGKGRPENRSQLQEDIESMKPTHVFNVAGVTGCPNVDWCESHKVQTIQTSVVKTLNLDDLCHQHGLILISYATGCIFEYDEKHPLGSGIRFKEEDTPNFMGSYYSKTKAMVEDLLKNFKNVCTLRVRMPISSDLSNPRNFLSKKFMLDCPRCLRPFPVKVSHEMQVPSESELYFRIPV